MNFIQQFCKAKKSEERNGLKFCGTTQNEASGYHFTTLTGQFPYYYYNIEGRKENRGNRSLITVRDF